MLSLRLGADKHGGVIFWLSDTVMASIVFFSIFIWKAKMEQAGTICLLGVERCLLPSSNQS